MSPFDTTHTLSTLVSQSFLTLFFVPMTVAAVCLAGALLRLLLMILFVRTERPC